MVFECVLCTLSLDFRAVYREIRAPIEYPTSVTLPLVILSNTLFKISDITSTDKLGLSECFPPLYCNFDPPCPGRSIAMHLVDLETAFMIGTQSSPVPKNP